MMDKELSERIITALVATVLKLSQRIEGENFHALDKNRLDKWNQIEADYFSETENISFYRGKGLEVFDIVLFNAIVETPRKLRTEQLYRTEPDGVEEEAEFFRKSSKKAGGKG